MTVAGIKSGAEPEAGAVALKIYVRRYHNLKLVH
jgi:hypothetical protein